RSVSRAVFVHSRIQGLSGSYGYLGVGGAFRPKYNAPDLGSCMGGRLDDSASIRFDPGAIRGLRGGSHHAERCRSKAATDTGKVAGSSATRSEAPETGE